MLNSGSRVCRFYYLQHGCVDDQIERQKKKKKGGHFVYDIFICGNNIFIVKKKDFLLLW